MGGSSRVRASVRLSERVRPATHQTIELPAVDALDAAFEEYTRVDVGACQVEAPCGKALLTQESRMATDSRASGNARSMTKYLVADIAAQLGILDRQREHLAALLRDAV
jgi:hypothetical protein